MHIYAAENAEGTIEIQSVYTTMDDTDNNQTVRVIWNDFLGADTVDKTKNPVAWWAGSSKGIIQKRAVTIEDGGILNVVKTTSTGKYQYAIVEAEGDLENLSVATTTDGEAWSFYTEFSYAIPIDEVKGFSFKYEGESNVVIRKIFLTNFQEDAVASKYPYLDPATTQNSMISIFAKAALPIIRGYVNSTQMEPANLYYRISYNNGNLLEVKDGFGIDASESRAQDYINYKSETRTPAVGYSILSLR